MGRVLIIIYIPIVGEPPKASRNQYFITIALLWCYYIIVGEKEKEEEAFQLSLAAKDVD